MKTIKVISRFEETIVSPYSQEVIPGGMSYTEVIAKYKPEFDGEEMLRNLVEQNKLSGLIRQIVPGTGIESFYFVKPDAYESVLSLINQLFLELNSPPNLTFEIVELDLRLDEVLNLLQNYNYVLKIYDYSDFEGFSET
jgi:hypothetical protein